MARWRMCSSSATRPAAWKWRWPNGRVTRLRQDGQSLTITLYDGERYEGVPGSAQFRIIKKFSQLTIPVRAAAAARCGRGPGRRPDAAS